MHSVRTRGTARSGAVDWIAAGLAGLLLISATACAGTGTAPAAAPTALPTVSTAGSPAAASPEPGAEDTPNQQPAFAAKALDVLATIPVKGRAPKTGYSRDQFGQAWADVDRNGCDTRNDVLRRDLTDLALKPGTGDCVVLSGILNDPYTAILINFLRGNSTSDAVQIDHVVALSDAWQKGAQQLTEAQRLSFANDPLNLLAVDGPANQQKSDGDAATWLPANKSYRCDYVARQISVKSSYGLWVTAAEHDAMARVLGDCPGQAAPTSQAAPAPPTQAATPAPAPAAPAAPANPASVYYANCAAARAAGAAPLRAGQPGYREQMDGDRDGIACE
ncbi:GmrSD restriction endonuclease domain-containing protein [Arthrobacter sp. PsM3]|uniref:GmrSD restriction endonuclease domain-containing protein n=1 Tax=Arthrobacter sp. PsM3 TaxID=3030531 RepID=UPI00263B57B4|nr:DUF1524 domain-containing protein [Arthrobacter sp. PsM3]MDN4644348.1 DUF1524 domain-containing protein [Arthrobacter sp. PsM3]